MEKGCLIFQLNLGTHPVYKGKTSLTSVLSRRCNLSSNQGHQELHTYSKNQPLLCQ